MKLASQICLGGNQADGTYMHSSFVRVGADFVTIFKKASILLLTISIHVGDRSKILRLTVFSPFALRASIKGS